MTADADLNALYQRELREMAAKIRADKRLVPADISVTRTSPVCGSSVTIDIRRDGAYIHELGWRTRACTLGMAATAIVVQAAIDQNFKAVEEIAAMLRRLLQGEDVTFPAGWQALEMFAAARTFPSRHGSIMLPFEALAEAAQL
ncbi:iron-sulfur cluster assembly scaffold protein [Pseudochrobactrum sp. HB0163]|uniref:iron-sulfur cluster assembly scaffold protein n=1 Tax=Pseudochrobactrum sp. HB0163 TaxID=3450708 RepID=UPI003F6DF3C9